MNVSRLHLRFYRKLYLRKKKILSPSRKMLSELPQLTRLRVWCSLSHFIDS
jgi:hypothetical protein